MRKITILLSLGILLCFCSYAGELDDYMASKGLVDVSTMDPSLQVLLKYATSDNIMLEKVYEGITGAWLHPEAAAKLVQAQKTLKQKYPDYSIIIYDAARPMSVQKKMWDMVKGTNKTNYVSNPANGGGLHNYGMAVDVSIVDQNGIPLSMGTPFDYFGEEAHINNEQALVKNGKITQEELTNRLLLRQIMKEAGFRTILYEWWHFNACSRAEARASYPLID